MEYSGACRNQNDEYNEKGSGSGASLYACQKSCDATQGCGAVTWDSLSKTCYMTSQMAYTTAEITFKCYLKANLS